MARIIDGKELAATVRDRIAHRVQLLRQLGVVVRLDAILVCGEGDAASRVYAEGQRRRCADLGIEYQLHELAAGVTQRDVAHQIRALNADPEVHAIMVHMPLPEGMDPYRIQSLIAPGKDVEGVNPANIGNIVHGRSSLAPCTALAVMRMIEFTEVDLRGRVATVVGASNIVGKPVAAMLMQREATVISCNEFTREIRGLTTQADVLVAAAGVPGLVHGDWVRPGAIVIDVGINRVRQDDGSHRTVGDVAFEEACEAIGDEGWISPVPGGVGPVTVAVLMENVVAAAEAEGKAGE
ncbi:MAG: bifunctional 5,10-methylenetetrahydrofolate dehydrogenase/5,10-methenyltetrahydrofolate cyclohydrolase [Phycisphaerales bacterium]|nr:bifunctional 5,10-methylenetetrahydrofolate dehydrogenase/5,10-methenyltetrahydrofolate cyclohydrolase [Phycisphaerales bacterium]